MNSSVASVKKVPGWVKNVFKRKSKLTAYEEKQPAHRAQQSGMGFPRWALWLLFFVVVFNATSQLLLKTAALGSIGADHVLLALVLNPAYVLSIMVYGISFLFWQRILHVLPLSFAYPFCSITYVLVPAFSWLIYGEVLSLRYGVGLVFLCVGITLTAGAVHAPCGEQGHASIA